MRIGGGGGPRRAGGENGNNDGHCDSGPIQVFSDDNDNSQEQVDPRKSNKTTRATMLRNLQGMLTQVDQVLPERSQAVRQKLTDMGMNNPMADFANQMRNVAARRQRELAAAASNAPGPLQSALYRQAAQKAIDEGNLDRAQQIANDHLDENGKNSVTQAIDFKKLQQTSRTDKLAEIRTKLAALPSDADRIKYLADLASRHAKRNPKTGAQICGRCTRARQRSVQQDYRDMENQLARRGTVRNRSDPKRSFDVLEPGISQLNELLAAAQVLNGFEVEVYRDGELPLQGGSDWVR
jgi:hypothetical protein